MFFEAALGNSGTQKPVANDEHTRHAGWYFKDHIDPVHWTQGTPAGEGSREGVTKEPLYDVVNNLGIKIKRC
jgi:hypothetical protein